MNKTKRRRLLAGLFSVPLMVMIFVLYMLYMPHRNIQREKPVYVTTNELISAFQENETSANQKFLDKVLQIEGTVDHIELNGDRNVVAVLSGNNPITTVRCTFLGRPDLKDGSVVTLKGRCTGYLMDVIVIDCLLIEN